MEFEQALVFDRVSEPHVAEFLQLPRPLADASTASTRFFQADAWVDSRGSFAGERRPGFALIIAVAAVSRDEILAGGAITP